MELEPVKHAEQVNPTAKRPTPATVLSRLTRLDEDFAETDAPPVRPEDTL